MHYADLHLHLDGSLPLESILRLAELGEYTLPTTDLLELKKLLTVNPDCTSLNEYLEKFDLPIALLQTKESLEFAMMDLLRVLSEQKVVYAEVRFAPALHCQKGLSQKEVLESVLSGLKKAMEQYPIRGQVIACCMRGADNNAENVETVRTAKEYLDKGVCCIDLAGAEALFPTKDFAELFQYAKEKNVPFIIHAGEADGPQSIRDAVHMGALRIGHGVASIQDAELVSMLADRKIPLEVCITSNLQTKAVPDLEHHPIRQLLESGVAVLLNTDNMTVSGTTMAQEFALAESAFRLTSEQVIQLQKNAAHAAFLSEKEQEQLLTQLLED